MIELPECAALAIQLNSWIAGKTIASAAAAESPHKFAWYSGDPADYSRFLADRTATAATARANYLSVGFGDLTLLFAEGVALRALESGSPRPPKRQLRLEFTDGAGLCASVQMYGGLWLFRGDDFDNAYYRRALSAVSLLSEDFTFEYFQSMANFSLSGKSSGPTLTAKAFLASDQRIPGLGNGCLQDILWTARIHPKRKIGGLGADEWRTLYDAVRGILRDMTEKGGRDTETDLFGVPGSYCTVASKNTVGVPCPRCGTAIAKEAYMGGSVYFCPDCQKA